MQPSSYGRASIPCLVPRRRDLPTSQGVSTVPSRRHLPNQHRAQSMVGRWLPPTRREAQKPGFQCTVDSVRILFPAPLLTANFRLTIRLVREDRRQTPFLTRRQRTVVFIPVHKWPPQGRSQALSEPLIEAQLFYAVSQPSPPFAAQSCAERTPICCAVHTAQYCCPLAPYAPLLGM